MRYPLLALLLAACEGTTPLEGTVNLLPTPEHWESVPTTDFLAGYDAALLLLCEVDSCPVLEDALLQRPVVGTWNFLVLCPWQKGDYTEMTSLAKDLLPRNFFWSGDWPVALVVERIPSGIDSLVTFVEATHIAEGDDILALQLVLSQ